MQLQSLNDHDQPEAAAQPIVLRNLKPKDYHVLERILYRVPAFTEEDQGLAMELVDIALNQPNQKDYVFLIAVNEADYPVGYACFGPTPLTEGTFDLYWIAVDPTNVNQGIGSLLLQAVEQQICDRAGRMLLIETSSSPAYALTRRFYLKKGYELAETIPDFFRIGEDRVTYIKKF